MATFISKISFDKLKPHAVAIIVMILLSCFFFAPVIFDDKQLPQGDVISSYGMGHDAKNYHDQTGEYSHWSNSMFCGMPHNYSYTAPSKSVFRHIESVLKLGLPSHTVALVFLYLLGFYIFMLCIGCSPWLSLVGAIAFSFASYNIIIIEAGHINKCLVIATMAPIIGGVFLCYNKKYIPGAIITILAVGLNAYWSHQQISYYLIIMLFCLAAAFFINACKSHYLKQFAVASIILIFSALLSVIPAADKLIPTMDYQKESMRGGAVLQNNDQNPASGLDIDYAYMWSYGKTETFTLLIPGLMGASSNYALDSDSETYRTIRQAVDNSTAKQFNQNAPVYWGDQPFTSGPVYAGAIICLLFVLGLLTVESKNKWWLVIAAIIGIVLSWGRNLPGINGWLFNHLPLYNKFRTPSMALVITTTSMAMLAMMALKKVIDKEVTIKQLAISFGIVGGLSLLFAFIPNLAGNFNSPTDSQYPSWLIDALIKDRRSLLVSDAWRSFAYIAISCVILYFYLKSTKFKQWLVCLFMGLLILSDLWSVDRRFVDESDFVPKSQVQLYPTEADKQIMADTDPDYRVINLTSNTFNDSRTSYFHKSVGGYSPAKLRRYQDIIDHYFSEHIDVNVLSMLNTRYIVTQESVQNNPYAMGNAWFVNQVNWADSPDDEIEAIGNVDLNNTAVIDKCWKESMNEFDYSNTNASISLSEYASPDHLIYESMNDSFGLAVFSEVYYKTWKAYVDGVEVPVLRANYILRAIEIPSGKHQIEFRCIDEVLVKSQIISLVSSIILVLCLIVLASGALIKFRHD